MKNICVYCPVCKYFCGVAFGIETIKVVRFSKYFKVDTDTGYTLTLACGKLIRGWGVPIEKTIYKDITTLMSTAE